MYISRLKKLAMFVYKSYNDTGPGLTNDIFNKKDIPYNLRDNSRVEQPLCSMTRYGLNSIVYQGASLWNSLPHDLKNCIDAKSFQNMIKSWNGHVVVASVYYVNFSHVVTISSCVYAYVLIRGCQCLTHLCITNLSSSPSSSSSSSSSSPSSSSSSSSSYHNLHRLPYLICIYLKQWLSHYYTPRTTKLLGGILVSLRPSVHPSIRPSVPPVVSAL